MKQLIFILLLLVSGLVTAQEPPVYYRLATHDTLTNADTGIYAYPTRIYWTYGYSLHCTSTDYSGGATGTAYLQGSLDNVYWVDLDTVNTWSNSTTSGMDYETTGVMYPYLRVYALNAGSGVSLQNAYLAIYPRDAAYKYPMQIWNAKTAWDTATNTVTKTYLYNGSTVKPLSGVYSYTIQFDNDSISGSGTSTVTVAWSNDGTTWNTISSNALTSDSTIVISNVTGCFAKYLKVVNTHSGSGVDRDKVYGVVQKRVY
jgi:hypothetical protein